MKFLYWRHRINRDQSDETYARMGEGCMKSRFKIDKTKRKDAIHLRLMGEFTDVSICELIEVLKGDCWGSRNVFIHTDQLQNVSVSGFGRDVFRKNLIEFEDHSHRVHFTGNKEGGFVPEGVWV